MKSVALHNLGCKVNSYEMDFMQQILQENGYRIVPFDEVADIYIINTCTVTNVADHKSRQMIHRARRRNPAAVVVAVGCFVQVEEDALRDAAIDLAVGNNRKKDLFPLLEEFLINREKEGKNQDKTLHGKSLTDIAAVKEYESMTLSRTTGHTRAFIKIQDGCNQFCSYCIIPYARGRVRSRNPEEIIGEVRGLAENGCREVVLTGIHISSYGIDRGDETLLLDLIKRLHDIPHLKRIRLGSLEPRIITGEFAGTIAALDKVCPHFHLSLQSGCDETLKRMNRRYTTAEYAEKAALLRQAYPAPGPALTTDVIVGFPGETEKEFAQTHEFLEKLSFYEMHIFKYSRRKGTKAAAMAGQISEAEKTERSRRLLLLHQTMARQYRESFLGREAEIILEETKTINGREYWLGYTKEYLRTAIPREAAILTVGESVTGRLTGFLTPEILLLENLLPNPDKPE